MATPARPLGITVIAILAAIGGVFGIIGGLALVGLSGALAAATGTLFGLSPMLYGVLLIVLGAAQLYAAYGAWTLKGWAWTWLVVLMVISAVLNILPRLNILGLAIAAVVVFYLFTPDVKKAFGRA